MTHSLLQSATALGVGLGAAALFATSGGNVSRPTSVTLPAPAVDAPIALPAGQQVAVFSGGCFWGIQAVFEHVKGVTSATSGYAGGSADGATYEQVSSGTTGHAESVRVIYDSSQVSYGQLLRVFFSVAHDPTQLNRQGPDHGTQYRSAIWYTTKDQQRIAQAYIDQLTKAKTFPNPIVTQVAPLRGFYPAEKYHQDYALHHPEDPYIVINDAPKVAALHKQFPELWRESPVTFATEEAAKR